MTAFASLLLYSELSVLLCALGLGGLAYRVTGLTPDPLLLGFIGAAAFFFYSLERNLTLPPLERSVFPQKSRWITEHRKTNLALLTLSGSIGFALFWRLSPMGMLSFLSLAALALAYSMVKIPWRGRLLRAKEVYYLKPLLLVAVWVYLTLLLPLIEAGAGGPSFWNLPKAGLFSLEFWGAETGGRFLRLDLWATRSWAQWSLPLEAPALLLLCLIWVGWIFSNSIFFDIRDLRIDQQDQSPTLAMTLGRERAHDLIGGLFLLQLMAIVAYAELTGHSGWILALSLGSLAFLALNERLRQKPEEPLSFYIAADLTLTLPALALLTV